MTITRPFLLITETKDESPRTTMMGIRDYP